MLVFGKRWVLAGYLIPMAKIQLLQIHKLPSMCNLLKNTHQEFAKHFLTLSLR